MKYTIDTRVKDNNRLVANGSLDSKLQDASKTSEAEFDREYFLENKLYTFPQRVAYGAQEKASELVDLVKNPVGFFKKVYEGAKKEGPYFAAYAVAVELTEDVVVPIILTATNHAEWVPVLWAIHTEPVMYPLYFAARGTYRLANEGLDVIPKDFELNSGDVVTERYGVIA